jgi:Tfp pilus assembly protein PilN
VAGLKDINLFEGIKKSAPVKKSNRPVAIGLVLLIACAAAVGGLYFWMSTQKTEFENEIAAANRQISASQDTGSGEATFKQGRLSAIRSYNAMLEALDENVNAYPKLDEDFFRDLESRLPGGVTVQTFGYQNGVLTLDCTAGDPDAFAGFADALAKSDYMDAVNLKSSQLDTQAQIDSGVVQYDFSIECYLKGGRPNETDDT